MSAWLHEHRAEPSLSPECNKSRCGSHHCYDQSDGQLWRKVWENWILNKGGWEEVCGASTHTKLLLFLQQGKGEVWVPEDQLSGRGESNNSPANNGHIEWTTQKHLQFVTSYSAVWIHVIKKLTAFMMLNWLKSYSYPFLRICLQWP